MKRAALYLRVSTDRQVGRAFSEEGYSVETQREACQRRARELEAEVVAEYVDYGDSARVADRPNFQKLLTRIREQRDLDLVLVYKVSRFARNTYDDIVLAAELEELGVEIVSAMEHFDKTPFGKRMRRYAAADAEFYSEVLSEEVKRGLYQKAKLGGTPGPAPVGYLNVQQRDEATGRYIATVEVDPERAPHITWAFMAYATGNHTLDTLCAELEKRGLRTRRTTKQGGGPLSRTQLSRLLVNPYYIGTVRYGKAENPNGQHEPLIDKLTFSVVQKVLDAHAMACERDRKHHHYLKGSLHCDLCGERVSFVKGKSKSGRRYDYFACLGRVKGTGCKLPYIPTEKIEEQVPREYEGIKVVQLGARTTEKGWHLHLDEVRAALQKAMGGLDKENEAKRNRLRAQLQVLDGESGKLVQAFLADALPTDVLKKEQDRVKDERAWVDRELVEVSADVDRLAKVFHFALDAAREPMQAYCEANGAQRRFWNQAFFQTFRVKPDGTVEGDLRDELRMLTAADTPKRLRAETRKRVSLGRCSNRGLLAEREGFEPSRELAPPTRLAGECLQPLGHLSGASDCRATAGIGSCAMPSHAEYEAIFDEVEAPFAFVDLDAMRSNGEEMLGRAGEKPIRVASKSLRCRSLIQRILESDERFRGLMTFTLAETLWLAEQGFEDLLLAYPTADAGGLGELALRSAANPEASPILMVDCADHLEAIETVLGAGAAPVRVCIDVDASWWALGGRLKVGPKRSPVHTVEQAVALAREIEARPQIELAALMAYEGQIAGVGDRPPGRRLRGATIRMMQRRSARELAERRAAIVAAVREVAELDIVNGGGTGSLELTAAEETVTEVTAGSGFYAPALFDHYSRFSLSPAAGFALPIVRKPAPRVATALGGGYLASGSGDTARLPSPWLPPGLALDAEEGAGEVQTPLSGPAAAELAVGDRVYLRHAKAGELCERFNSLYLVEGGEVVDEVPTYRGEGKAFL
jgi:D-serine deaminase-like pyridoxal phosphate-dependent protein/DNA invertase Pin-like site-specific DNA recombinase